MSTDCVPLCGADRAYGKRAAWWRYEPRCPARASRSPSHEEHDGDDSSSDGDDPDGVHPAVYPI